MGILLKWITKKVKQNKNRIFSSLYIFIFFFFNFNILESGHRESLREIYEYWLSVEVNVHETQINFAVLPNFESLCPQKFLPLK